MSSRALLVALCALLLGLGSCARAPSSASRANWKQLRDEGRLVRQIPALDAIEREVPYKWSGGTVELGVEAARHPLGGGLRLTTEIEGPRGTRSPFILDTGSTSSWLSWGSPLADEAHVAPNKTCKVVYGTMSCGHWGYLAKVRMGPLRGGEFALVLREEDHSLNSAANVLGFPHFFHTQLEHAGGRWTLRSGADRLEVIPGGWMHVPFVPGLPIVKIEDPAGHETYAVLDTGAPENYALRGARRGTYALPTADGSATLPLRVSKTGPFPVATLWGHRVTVLIGMQWLAGHDWRMTFDKATWAFKP